MTRMITAALGLLTLGACAAAHMAVPVDVAQSSEQLPIVDRSSWSGALADESFKLGPYEVRDVDRKWDSTRTTSLFGDRMRKTTGGYSFALSGRGAALSGTCATEARERKTNLGDGWSFGATIGKLGCNCGDSSGNADLVLESDSTHNYEGMLKTSGGEYRVTSINEREGGSRSFDPTGYRVDGSDGAKGAVDILGTGRVWVSKSLEARQRAEVVCVFAGLLLYQPPRER